MKLAGSSPCVPACPSPSTPPPCLAVTPPRSDKHFWLSFYGLPDNERLRALRSSRIGKLSQFVGTVTRTTDVRPELFSGTFRCMECMTGAPAPASTGGPACCLDTETGLAAGPTHCVGLGAGMQACLFCFAIIVEWLCLRQHRHPAEPD